MTTLIPVTPNHTVLLSNWFHNDPEGQKRLGLYASYESWAKFLEPQKRFGWIAYDENDEAFGFVDLEKMPKNQAYFSFYIAAEQRGKGKSRQLLQALVHKARQLHIAKLMGTAEKDNPASQNALASFGFEQAGIDKDGFLIYALRS